MWAPGRCLRRPQKFIIPNASRNRLGSSGVQHKTDEHGIPVKPTWSVHELLSSYPEPTLSSSTLARLHKLSALNPPAEGTPEHARLKEEMEEIIRLVEAVKLVATHGVQPTSHLSKDEKSPNPGLPLLEREAFGQELLQHAARTSGGFYVVDSDRRRL
ncbi:hypothetical protein LshimejAT787_0103950 [Lyophyllum shimeji]|uniref:Uncharacterized protein n=1 Tax=Lyophyllum shimeji TaxID=47721 RepID=A0A9P3PDL2_LYOSH|nr:hypothetical protein LshimejAT787_0103950 [Lyophyllum shimeji]